jgi:CDP-glucose 4,6-dehydratase
MAKQRGKMESLVNQEYLRSFYKGKKVFVTGHTGFKGSWLIALLHVLEAKIKGYALAPEYENTLYQSLGPLHLYESVIKDIRDKKTLAEEIISFQPDFIFHLAAQPLVRKSYEIPSETFDVNVTGTANILEAIRYLKKKCAVLIITTDKVYENKESEILYKEDDRLGGYDPYSASKACTELVVSSFRNSFFNLKEIDDHKIAIASVRAGNVIGGGDRSTDRIVPDIVKALEQKKIIEVRNPKAVRPWQHVLEPLGGYLLLGGLLNESPLKFSSAYNFGPYPEDHLTVEELVNLSIKIWGNGKWKDASNNAQFHEAGLLRLDITKALNYLCWKPKLNASQAIDWTMNWYKTAAEKKGELTFQQIHNYLAL